MWSRCCDIISSEVVLKNIPRCISPLLSFMLVKLLALTQSYSFGMISLSLPLSFSLSDSISLSLPAIPVCVCGLISNLIPFHSKWVRGPAAARQTEREWEWEWVSERERRMRREASAYLSDSPRGLRARKSLIWWDLGSAGKKKK